jgi:hypothetical protein
MPPDFLLLDLRHRAKDCISVIGQQFGRIAGGLLEGVRSPHRNE